MTAVPFPQELRVGDHAHVVAAQHVLDHFRRSDRHRRLVHDDRTRGEDRRDLRRRGLDVRQVGTAVFVLRGRHAQEHDVGVDDTGGGSDDEPQTPGRNRIDDELSEPLLDDRDLALLEPPTLSRVDVGTHDVEPEMGEAGARRQTDVARADDGKSRCRWGKSEVGHRPGRYQHTPCRGQQTVTGTITGNRASPGPGEGPHDRRWPPLPSMGC